MVRHLDLDAPARLRFDRKRRAPPPIDAGFQGNWPARDLQIERRVASDRSGILAVDEDVVAPQPVRITGTAHHSDVTLRLGGKADDLR